MPPERSDPRRPRLALMGEFSAGKTTLANLLVGAEVLPTKVTATALPPVWIVDGEDLPRRVDLAGLDHPVDDLARVGVADTRYLRVACQSDLLELCDLIDMPGISDPNMDPAVWRRMVAEADAIFWCTAATQAWRRSEAAVWEEIDPAVRARSRLVVTRMDMIATPRDADRLLRRVRRETTDSFAAVHPVALPAAMAAEDAAAWRDSGVEALVADLLDLVEGFRKTRPTHDALPQRPVPHPQNQPATAVTAERHVIPRRVPSRRQTSDG